MNGTTRRWRYRRRRSTGSVVPVPFRCDHCGTTFARYYPARSEPPLVQCDCGRWAVAA